MPYSQKKNKTNQFGSRGTPLTRKLHTTRQNTQKEVLVAKYSCLKGIFEILTSFSGFLVVFEAKLAKKMKQTICHSI